MLAAVTIVKSQEDREYLSSLYKQYGHMLMKVANSILQNKNDAEDVVIDAMLSLFSLVPKLREMEEQERIGYLRATVRNSAFKYYKACKQQNVTKPVPIASTLFSLQENDPANIIEKNEEYQLVHNAIATLPDTDRKVLYLKYSARLTAQEIAEIINAPSEEAVRMRLSRARHKVMSLLREWGVER